MFIDYSDYEKKDFLSQSQTYFIPGYTGHCPTLKFQFGKCYGTSTREIIETLSKNGIIRRPPKIGCNYSRSQIRNSELTNRKYILGYTGYIPGMYKYHGLSFRQLADKYESEQSLRKVSSKKKRNSLNAS